MSKSKLRKFNEFAEIITRWSRKNNSPLSFELGLDLANMLVEGPKLLPACPEARAKGDETIRNYIRTGLKIKAIKRYRELTKLGLKESKMAIDAMQAYYDAYHTFG